MLNIFLSVIRHVLTITSKGFGNKTVNIEIPLEQGKKKNAGSIEMGWKYFEKKKNLSFGKPESQRVEYL